MLISMLTFRSVAFLAIASTVLNLVECIPFSKRRGKRPERYKSRRGNKFSAGRDWNDGGDTREPPADWMTWLLDDVGLGAHLSATLPSGTGHAELQSRSRAPRKTVPSSSPTTTLPTYSYSEFDSKTRNSPCCHPGVSAEQFDALMKKLDAVLSKFETKQDCKSSPPPMAVVDLGRPFTKSPFEICRLPHRQPVYMAGSNECTHEGSATPTPKCGKKTLKRTRKPKVTMEEAWEATTEDEVCSATTTSPPCTTTEGCTEPTTEECDDGVTSVPTIADVDEEVPCQQLPGLQCNFYRYKQLHNGHAFECACDDEVEATCKKTGKPYSARSGCCVGDGATDVPLTTSASASASFSETTSTKTAATAASNGAIDGSTPSTSNITSVSSSSTIPSTLETTTGSTSTSAATTLPVVVSSSPSPSTPVTSATTGATQLPAGAQQNVSAVPGDSQAGVASGGIKPVLPQTSLNAQMPSDNPSLAKNETGTQLKAPGSEQPTAPPNAGPMPGVANPPAGLVQPGNAENAKPPVQAANPAVAAPGGQPQFQASPVAQQLGQGPAAGPQAPDQAGVVDGLKAVAQQQQQQPPPGTAGGFDPQGYPPQQPAAAQQLPGGPGPLGQPLQPAPPSPGSPGIAPGADALQGHQPPIPGPSAALHESRFGPQVDPNLLQNAQQQVIADAQQPQPLWSMNGLQQQPHLGAPGQVPMQEQLQPQFPGMKAKRDVRYAEIQPGWNGHAEFHDAPSEAIDEEPLIE